MNGVQQEISYILSKFGNRDYLDNISQDMKQEYVVVIHKSFGT